MGLLSIFGDTYSYSESKPHIPTVHRKGLIQFLKLYSKYYMKKLHDPPVIWGDEIEYHVISLKESTKKAQLQCDAVYLEGKFEKLLEKPNFILHPEYGAWMVETTPSKPFQHCCHLDPIINNMMERRKIITQLLENDDKLFTIPVFPLLGVGKDFFLKKEGKISNDVTNSKFINDEIINPYIRFPTLTKNIRERREENVEILIPLFIDKNTKVEKTEEEPFPGFIYMDAMPFGMGNCCLQTTFATRDINHARYFYDQMGIIAPMIIPLTAGSCIFKGKLANTDARWKSIVNAVDDRTKEERDKNSSKYIPKSRYDSISFFISNDPRCLPEYNDLKFPVNKEAIKFLQDSQEQFNVELDKQLLNHLGFLYLREPLVIFKEDDKQAEDPYSTKDFENIQSTNWNSVRFKPPPNLNSEINWRVEFRPMEIQITEQENGFFAFLALQFLRMLSFDDFKLNFYIPISYVIQKNIINTKFTKVDENFERAMKKDAVLTEKFYIRKNIFDDGPPEIIELSLHEFFFGNSEFIGYQKLLSSFIEFNKKNAKVVNLDQFESCCQEQKRLLNFIKAKTTGAKKTLAAWIRNFVMSHKDYKQDSIVSEEIAYDLLQTINDIVDGKRKDDNFATD